jgi:hypothetical protein
MNRLLAPSTNSDSAAAGCDRAVSDIHARRSPRTAFGVPARGICNDVGLKLALEHGCNIFIGSPHTRFTCLSPRIAQ